MSRSTYLPRLSSLLLLVLLLLPLSAFAQFNFGNMFNQQQQQHQHHQQQADPSRNRGWQAQKDIPCNKYLCPATFDCVEYPSHCPCPYPEDRKCFLPLAPGEAQHDASFVCQRGPTEKGCEDVRKRAMGRW